MALSNIEKHYNKHPEDLRLQRRHGIVEFETTMYHLHRYLQPGHFILDIGAGTGRYTSALMAEGYRVKAVELVRRNIEVFLKREPGADVVQGDARNMPFLASGVADVTLLLGPLYHLIGEDEKLKALQEARRVTKPGGLILVAYLMNEYSILSYCFDEERICDFLARGVVDGQFHIQAQEDELYDYVRLEGIDRLNQGRAGARDHLLARWCCRLHAYPTQWYERGDVCPVHCLPEVHIGAGRPDWSRQPCGGCAKMPGSVAGNNTHTFNRWVNR